MKPTELDLRPGFPNPFNWTALPAISLPHGFAPDGWPVGLQIIAKAFEEIACFRIAYAYEQATEWHERRPSL